MTAPQPKATSTRKAPAKKPPATVTPIDTAKTAEKAAAKKAPAAKAPAAEKPKVERQLAKVGPMPKPHALDWTEKDGKWLAVSGRWTYRVTEGSSGGWFAVGGTGSPVPLHGDAQPTVEAAKRIAETVDAGAKWTLWTRYRTMPWAQLVEVGAEAGKEQ